MRRRVFFAGIICIVFVGVANRVTGQGLTVHLTLEKDVAMIGEPLLLKYTIANATDRPITVELGKDREGWLKVELTRSGGGTVPERMDRERKAPGGFRVATTSRLAGGQCLTGEWVVTRRFRVSRPGAYTLKVMAGLTARDEDGKALHASTIGGPFALTETEAVSGRLDEAARRLLAEIQSCTLDSAGVEARVDALFTMPVRVAGPYWAQLALDPTWMRRALAIAYLERSDTVEAADILASVWKAPSSDDTLKVQARRGLLFLHGAQSAALRKHVEQIFVKWEGKAPAWSEGDAAVVD